MPYHFKRTFTEQTSKHRCIVAFCVALIAVWALAGCTTFRNVDSTVQSYSTIITLPSPATFRIEPLPSQQQDLGFSTIARMTCTALQGAGLQRDDAHAALTITISTQASYNMPGWPYSPYSFSVWDSGERYGRRRGGITARAMLREQPPGIYRRSLQLLIRDAKTQQVVYETSAVHEDVWTQDPEIYGVLAQAALHGFPHPPTATRRVVQAFTQATDSADAPNGVTKAVVTPANATPAPEQLPISHRASHPAAGC
jgi:hypothetical protein